MDTSTNPALNLTETYLHLDGGRAEPMAAGERFWADVISGARPLPGWLVASFAFTEAGGATHAERHPNGDEVHVCVEGAMTAVLEHDDGEERIAFAAGQTCLVPRGTWHRLEATGPSRTVSLTFGEGTEHR